MDGLSRWDLVLWIVVAYGAVMALIRFFVGRRMPVRRLHRRLTINPGAAATVAANDHADAA